MLPEEAASISEQPPEVTATFGTTQPVTYFYSSSRVGADCGEDCGQTPLEHQGESLDGVMGWEEPAVD